ncbi:MAG: hypothetical protein ACTS73_01230 [Arsenophonus sp. NEOnobi-MAG3]
MKARKHSLGRDKRKEGIAVLIDLDLQDQVSNEILEKFNAECIRHFLEPIIEKESILCSYGENGTKLLPGRIKLVTIA